MLIEFRLKNFECFRDEQTFSLVASPIDGSLKNNLIEGNTDFKFPLVRTAVVYGANASGKTRFIKAFGQFINIITSSPIKKDNIISIHPFRLDDNSVNDDTEFEASFIHQGKRYIYGFSISKTEISREYLYGKMKRKMILLFSRNWDKEKNEYIYDFNAALKGANAQLGQYTGRTSLFLSTASFFQHPFLSEVFKWFLNTETSSYEYNFPRYYLDKLESFEKKKILEWIRIADLGITDFQIKKEKAEDIVRQLWRPLENQLLFTHEKKIGQEKFRFDEESLGTQAFINLAIILMDALNLGKTVFIDELDTSLHPLLVRQIITFFNDPKINIHNSQLVFNTHDTTLLNPELFRRDQIWFVEKAPDNSSHLYPLTEFNPRKNESFQKGYLNGRYGAIPFLGTFNYD